MKINLTEMALSHLSGGPLQRLAVDLLPRLHSDWGGIEPYGIYEGSSSTRKGTPDAYCERVNGTTVYIQATGDKKPNKVKEDLEKV